MNSTITKCNPIVSRYFISVDEGIYVDITRTLLLIKESDKIL